MDNEFKLVETGSREDLGTLQREKYESALRNLVTGKTPKEDFPGGKIPKRPIRGGSNTDYIPGWWFIDQANALFGHLWSFQVIDKCPVTASTEQIWVLGRITVHVPGKTVVTTTRNPDGSITTTEHKYEAVNVVKEQYGGSDIKKLKTGAIMDIADDFKSAATDAMKKALTSFGFGADIYGRRELLEQTSPIKSQLDALYRIGEKKGMDKKQVDDKIFTEYQKKPEELESVLVLGFIAKLRALPDKEG